VKSAVLVCVIPHLSANQTLCILGQETPLGHTVTARTTHNTPTLPLSNITAGNVYHLEHYAERITQPLFPTFDLDVISVHAAPLPRYVPKLPFSMSGYKLQV